MIIHWVACIQYKDKNPIWFGTLNLDANLRLEEVRKIMYDKISEYLPVGFEIIDLRRGQIWLSFD